MRSLPVAVSVAVFSGVGTSLSVRIGNKVVVAAGLLLVASAYAWVAAVQTPDTSYGVIVAQMLLLGGGIGMSTAPARAPVTDKHRVHAATHGFTRGPSLGRPHRIGTQPHRRLRVLDVGSGLGGPTRMIAAATGARVDGVDTTAEYVVAAQWLTDRPGLSERVSFTLSGIADYAPDELYDAAITLHVQMNVDDKTTWYSHIAQHLRAGGSWACGRCAPPTARP